AYCGRYTDTNTQVAGYIGCSASAIAIDAGRARAQVRAQVLFGCTSACELVPVKIPYGGNVFTLSSDFLFLCHSRWLAPPPPSPCHSYYNYSSTKCTAIYCQLPAVLLHDRLSYSAPWPRPPR
ncbi:hypothetical protein U1Q18_051107, partial [Sarracenia purpurea var. burkii]